MSKISIMNANLANLIAAGEVIDRPASVVKELVENSIDAKSKNIKIFIKNAGRTEIRIQDDGIGMDRIDAELAFLRHASSKVKTTFDLNRITTLGFRGEALPSIASISKVEMLTHDGSPNNPGTKVLVTPGHEPVLQDAPKRQGTTFIVHDLFFNTPARLKYLKSDKTESANIIETVEHLAIANPDISFELELDGKPLFKTSGRGIVLQTIKDIFGLELTKNMNEIEGENSFFKIKGYIGNPSISYSTRYHILSFVNSRSVYIYRVNQAIMEAYKDYLVPNRYPFAVIFIDVDYSLIDVNVHPSKKEVRLSEEQSLVSLVKQEIKKALLLIRPEYTSVSFKQKSEINTSPISAPSIPQQMKLEEAVTLPKETKEFEIEDLEKILLDLNEIEEKEEPKVVNEVSLSEPSSNTSEVEENLFNEPHTTIPELEPIGQVLKTYIICDGEDGFFLIDQHAAAERINFEKAIRSFNSNSVATVSPLVPILLDLPPSLFSRLNEESIAKLAKIGLTIEAFGHNSVRIVSLPEILKDENDNSILLDLVSSALKGEGLNLSDLKRLAIASTACKASIKANMFLSLQAMKALIRELSKCQNPANCPHGRPTIIKISKYEIEKLFKRSGL